ncbi:MAG: hypothetical protein ABI113_04120 [Mucilaginibacter sp.]
MKWGLIFCFIVIVADCFSQDKTVTAPMPGDANTVSGIVFDKESHDRIATVSIHNITTGIVAYDNLKGEFTIVAQAGDRLVFARAEYHPDTVKIKDHTPLAIYMAPQAIRLREVTIRDTAFSPERRLLATKQQFSKAYGSLAYNDFLSSSPGSGAGLSIDALWNSISKSGRNAERLRNTIEEDYEQNTIDFRFNRTYVGNITGLKDDRLTAFMTRYRPGFYTTKTATEYEFVAMIRSNLRRYLRNQRTYALPKLITPPGTN